MQQALEKAQELGIALKGKSQQQQLPLPLPTCVLRQQQADVTAGRGQRSSSISK